MDSSKLGKCSKVRVLDGDQVDVLVMDENISGDVREKYRNKGFLIQ